MREGLICIIHNVTPSTLGGGGGGAHLHRQSVSLYLGGRGSFASSESPSTLGGGGGGAHFV